MTVHEAFLIRAFDGYTPLLLADGTIHVYQLSEYVFPSCIDSL